MNHQVDRTGVAHRQTTSSQGWMQPPTAVVPAADDDLPDVLAGFRPIYLDQMQEVALLKRVEVKYVMPRALLPGILETLSGRYAVLEVEGQRLNRYRTLYFDTPDFAMYRRHHAGAADRFKVRSRTYLDSDSSFLEVKHKTNKKRVLKSRIQTDRQVTVLDRRVAPFVTGVCPYDPVLMQPRLWNSYRRITLVDTVRKERITLDVDLGFQGAGREASLPAIAVAEVKQERFSHGSGFVEVMRQHHIRRTGFSKYCMGASLIYPTLKQNRFKKKHRLVAKLATWEPATGGTDHELH